MSQDESPYASSGLSGSGIRPIDEEDDDHYAEHQIRDHHSGNEEANPNEHTYRQFNPPPHSAPVVQQMDRPFYHAVSTAKPTLMFAIASDDVAEVRRVLESGDAGANDAVGPQTALEFAMTNDQLLNKMEIVKTLLAYGADPRVLKQPNATVARRRASVVMEAATPGVAKEAGETQVGSLMDDIDPALRFVIRSSRVLC
jgi:signal transduction histidine kinase